MASSPQYFTVRRIKTELVSPAKPTPYEFKPLSDIDDQQALRFQVPFIFLYPHNPSVPTNQDPRLLIKRALSKALVYYYPLAGRLREAGPSGKLTVECTGEGILYTEADSDIKLEELCFGKRIQPPFPLDQLIFDVPGSTGILNCPLMLIQVTRLLCGGFTVAGRFNHTMGDAQGLVQFMNAVAEIARGGTETPSVQPVWERELIFKARDPPRVTHVHREYDRYPDEEYLPASEATNDHSIDHDDVDVVENSFYFGPSEISALRSHLPLHLKHSSSSFDIVTACVWRCRTIALNPAPTESARLLCAISGRGKLQRPLPVGYYGNVFSFPAAVTTSEKLYKSPLGYAVELIKKTKSEAMKGDYLQSVSDFMLLNNRPPFSLTRTTYIVSDNTRIGWTDVDFGWGRPLFGGPAETTSLGNVPGTISYYVRSRNVDEGEDGILVPIRLPKHYMRRFVIEVRGMIGITQITSRQNACL